jgi:hypothetical protein
MLQKSHGYQGVQLGEPVYDSRTPTQVALDSLRERRPSSQAIDEAVLLLATSNYTFDNAGHAAPARVSQNLIPLIDAMIDPLFGRSTRSGADRVL